MDFIERLPSTLLSLLPSLIVLAITALLLWGARRLLRAHRSPTDTGLRIGQQLVMLTITVAGLVILLLVLPIEGSTRDELLRILGLLLTAVIAFSSTTFVANIMAGIMLRALKNFRPGDFISIGEHFGRVTERGLFHVEIQTEDSNLATLPNLHLATQPVTVVRSTGTIVSATVSLGYDVPRARIERALLRAAESANLAEPFLRVLELGDFSVSYRIGGLLTEVKQLVSVRSRLRIEMLDALHEARIEIVSPTFMNQRRIPDDRTFIPPQQGHASAAEPENEGPDEIIFDKADQAQSQDALQTEGKTLAAEIEALDDQRHHASEGERASIDDQIASKKARIEEVTALLEASAIAPDGGGQD